MCSSVKGTPSIVAFAAKSSQFAPSWTAPVVPPAQAASVTIRTGDPEMRAVTRKRVIIRGDRGRHLGWERGRHRGWDDGGRRVVHKTIIRRGDGSRTVIRRSTED